MRVHHLEVTAFGPFAQTQSIDLDALGEAGLFLISGPTGSGKTSLLDAVSFALFGSVPGTRVPRTLRSQHADPDVAPQVVLEVTLSGRRFRIRRSPSFTRPGRKTAVQASVTLDELVDGSWAHLTGRLDEAGRILEDVLGMNAAQFHRVVVLPQGDFAAFLHASNDDRGELLRKLFDVDTFADVEAWLVDERKRLAAAARDAGHDVERVRHSLVRVLSTLPAEDDAAAQAEDGTAAQAGGDAAAEAEHDGWASLVGAELVAAVAEVDERVQQQATTALADADSTDAAHRTAERALAEARTRAERHDRGVAAQSALVDLESAADEQQARLERLDLAERAGRALAHQAALERAESHLTRTQAETDRAATAAGTELAALDDDGLAAWLGRLAEHDATVDELPHEGRRWQESLQRLPQLAADVDGATAGLAALTDERTRIAERLAAATLTREEARAAAADLDRLSGEARTLTTLIETRTELDELTAVTLPATMDLVRDARDRAQAARERHQDLIRQRLDDMAGELAESLSPGDPCLVCGSPEHPEPAQRRTRIDDAVLESAEGAWRDELAALDAAQASLAACQARAEQLTQALAEEPRERTALLRDAETLASEVERVRSVAATLPETASLLAELEAESARLEAREEALTARLHRSRGLLETEQARAAAGADAVAQLLAEHAGCPCLHDLDPTEADEGAEPETAAVARALAARSTHDAAGARARALQESRRALAAAGALVTEATDARDRALAAERIDTLDAAAAAVLDASTREQIAQEAGAYAERRAVVTDVLADPDVAAALEQPRPDVDGLTLALEHARTRWQGAATLLGQVQHAAREVAEHRKQLTELVAASGPVTARLELVTELADLASGRGDDNTDGISLTTYVLAVRLERIVALANERLSTMADGRYELEVDHGRSDKRSRGGLGLQVLDQWTGSHRPATTLSGGETFMVSLALALGTADAVREESGGIDLQTLFIDEGFGSLDDAALEQVLTVLDDLRSGGRSVGVISHVADMRQRIPAQLRVTKTAIGSSVDVTLDVEDAA